jgi:hypothetical protein
MSEMNFHLAELLTLLTMAGACLVAALRVIRAADRVGNVLKDFPPHRHVNGAILYPEGYEPTEIQRLYDEKSRGASA